MARPKKYKTEEERTEAARQRQKIYYKRRQLLFEDRMQFRTNYSKDDSVYIKWKQQLEEKLEKEELQQWLRQSIEKQIKLIDEQLNERKRTEDTNQCDTRTQT